MSVRDMLTPIVKDENTISEDPMCQELPMPRSQSKNISKSDKIYKTRRKLEKTEDTTENNYSFQCWLALSGRVYSNFSTNKSPKL